MFSLPALKRGTTSLMFCAVEGSLCSKPEMCGQTKEMWSYPHKRFVLYFELRALFCKK